MTVFMTRLALGAGLAWGFMSHCVGADRLPADPADPRAAVAPVHRDAGMAGYRSFDERDGTPPELWRRLNDAVAGQPGMPDGHMAPPAAGQTTARDHQGHEAHNDPDAARTSAGHAAMGHHMAPAATRP